MAETLTTGSRTSEAVEKIALGSVAITTRALASVGIELTFPQWRVLVIVGSSATGATVTEIAGRLAAEISPASRLVRRLRDRGLVSTGKDDRDRRVTRVLITPAGAMVRSRVFSIRRATIEQIVRELGPIDATAEAIFERLSEGFIPYT